MGIPISILVPSTAITQASPECEAVRSGCVGKLLIDLPRIIVVAYLAIGSAKGRISLQIDFSSGQEVGYAARSAPTSKNYVQSPIHSAELL